jgi:hypothetical protein
MQKNQRNNLKGNVSLSSFSPEHERLKTPSLEGFQLSGDFQDTALCDVPWCHKPVMPGQVICNQCRREVNRQEGRK